LASNVVLARINGVVWLDSEFENNPLKYPLISLDTLILIYKVAIVLAAVNIAIKLY